MTTTVRQILAGRAGVYMVSPDDTIFDALRLMAERNIGAVLVMSDGAIAGIVSERDYARKVVLLGRTSKTTPVREIMTTDVISVEPGWTADQCMALMTERRIRHLPVVENGTLVGIISIGDVVKHHTAEVELEVTAMRGYLATG